MSDDWDDLNDKDRKLVEAFFDQTGVLVRPSAVRAFKGNGNPAILISQLMFWHRVERERSELSFDGWFTRTIEEIEERTGFSQCSQETSRAILWSYDLLDVEKKGEHNQFYYRLNLKALARVANGESLTVVKISDARVKRLKRRKEKRAAKLLQNESVEAHKRVAEPASEPSLLPTLSETQANPFMGQGPLCTDSLRGHGPDRELGHAHEEELGHGPDVLHGGAPEEELGHGPDRIRYLLDSKTEISRNTLLRERAPEASVTEPVGVCVEKIPRSRHSKKLCIDFAEYLQSQKKGVKYPEAYGWEIYLDGRDDDRIDEFVLNRPPTPDQIAAARREAEAREVAFLETVSLVLDGIHDGQIRSWADAAPIASGFNWGHFKSLVRSQLYHAPELLRAFPFDDDALALATVGAGGG